MYNYHHKSKKLKPKGFFHVGYKYKNIKCQTT